jgi:hypothetical protein
VTFALPAGFGPTGAVVGDKVEARGTPAATAGGLPTLVRLEGGSNEQGHSGDDDGDDDDSGSSKVGTGQIGAGNGQPVSGRDGHGDDSGGDD